MKIFGVIVLVLLIAGGLIYADGARMPATHEVSVTGVVPAPVDKVFAMITDVKDGNVWRPEVKSVTTLMPDHGRDHWVEHLGHGQYMTFLAVQTVPPTLRQVKLDEPRAAYGGTWTYELSPGPTAASTMLKITEDGYINPPIYRFVMAHIIGPTKNLDDYMKDIQAAAGRY
ncbi:MAG TPA: SRPBCC family protein [Acidobacteriaceae bacterium]|nr:SRPBCC family protein [Acidobacteriaceae bacterium]